MAIEKAENKQITEAPNKAAETPVLQSYFFPEKGITIQATSYEEALAKLQALSDNKDTNI